MEKSVYRISFGFYSVARLCMLLFLIVGIIIQILNQQFLAVAKLAFMAAFVSEIPILFYRFERKDIIGVLVGIVITFGLVVMML